MEKYTKQKSKATRGINQLSEGLLSMYKFRLYWFKGMPVTVAVHVFETRGQNV